MCSIKILYVLLWTSCFFLNQCNGQSTDAVDKNKTATGQNTVNGDSNLEEKCPCVRVPNSNNCQPYDKHYQALTIEEAVIHFVDPTTSFGVQSMIGQSAQDSKNGKPTCTTPECMCCTLELLKKIRQSLSYDFNFNDKSLNSTEQNIKKRYRKWNNCKKYLAKCNIQGGLEKVQETGYPSTTGHKSQMSQRTKRQNGLGASTQLSCNYRRGNALADGSNYVGLCNLCWSIRTLPSNYFPRFINELTCDSDTRCLSGYGTCRERTRSVDVMINTGTDSNPRWSPVSVNSPVACECQIWSGSALHNLVSS